MARKVFGPDELHWTNDYRMFVKDKRNRDVNLDSKKHKELLKSIKDCGYLSQYPIVVFRNSDGEFVIKEGQTRFQISMMLGITFCFVVSKVEVDSYDLENVGPEPWSQKDIAVNFASRGLDNYAELNEFVNRTGIPYGLAAKLLSGNSSSSIVTQFRTQKFVVTDREYAEVVADLKMHFEAFDKKMTGTHLIKALAAVARVPYFDKSKLLKGMRANPGMLRKYSNRDDFLTMLEELYNYRNRSESVPLKVDALNALNARGRKKNKH